MTVNHPVFGAMCEICFSTLTHEQCAVDHEGTAWDVCAGDCARQAGIFAPVAAMLVRKGSRRIVARGTLAEMCDAHWDFPRPNLYFVWIGPLRYDR